MIDSAGFILHGQFMVRQAHHVQAERDTLSLSKGLRYFLILLCFFLTACPPAVKKRPVRPTPPKVVPAPVIQAPPPVPEPSRPERNASNDFLLQGKEKLEAQEYPGAMNLFHEAINLDPSNGPAYYYLAWSKYLSGDNEEILEILDRAEGLLSGRKDWLPAIHSLRQQVQSGIPPL